VSLVQDTSGFKVSALDFMTEFSATFDKFSCRAVALAVVDTELLLPRSCSRPKELFTAVCATPTDEVYSACVMGQKRPETYL